MFLSVFQPLLGIGVDRSVSQRGIVHSSQLLAWTFEARLTVQ